MKKIIISLLCIFTLQYSFSQINITTNSDATQLAQQLAGVGVTIANATINCPNSHSGSFTNAPNDLGISEGVVLATGLVTEIPGSPINFASTGAFTPGDADLDLLLTSLGESYGTEDACVLEFDITVIGDTLNFHYVMGSEEYPEYVCGSVNDIFGFFISGPNPSGGNYVNQNVALIPNTSIPVSINTINGGGSGSAATCFDGTYSAFYNDTVAGIIYDGNTVTLEATANTVPCGTYHFKLAIADGGDAVFDSGVFLEAGSFSSNGLLVSTSSILGQGFNTMIEGCLSGSIEFTLEDGPNLSGAPFAIPLSYTGSATMIDDYNSLPDTVWIAPGSSSTSLQVDGVNDLVTEGVEEIIINVLYSCGSVEVASLGISDTIPVIVTPTSDNICYGDTISFTASGAQSFIWNAPTADYISQNVGDTSLIAPSQTEVIQLFSVLGTCTGNTYIPVAVSNLTANITPTPITCPGFNDGSITTSYLNNSGAVTYDWNTGETTANISNLSPGDYTVVVSDGGCTIDLDYEMISPSPIEVEINTNNITIENMIEACQDAQITYTLVSGVNTTGNPFPVAIDFGGSAIEGVDFVTMPDTVWIANGQSSVTIPLTSISDSNNEVTEDIVALVEFACGLAPLDTIEINDIIAPIISVFSSPVCAGDFVSLEVFGNYTYQWEPAFLFFDPTSPFQFLSPNETTEIMLTSSIGTCNILDTVTIEVYELEFDVTVNDVSCAGENDGSIILTPLNAVGFVSYFWDNGEMSSSISNLSPGIYPVQVFDNSCFYSNSFTIEETNLSMQIDADNLVICKDDVVQFSVTNNLSTGTIYEWTPVNSLVDASLQNATSVQLTETTTFSLTGTNTNGCSISDNITIEVQSLDIEANYTDTTVGLGETTNIGVQIIESINLPNPISFDWTPTDFLANIDLQNTTTTPEENIVYVIVASSGECIDSTEITVYVGIELEMPNAFTPNGDGTNDSFNPVLAGGDIVEFRVFNRWGVIVHDNKDSGWDGTFNLKGQPADVYQYYIKVSNGNDVITKFGNVSLIY